jgi:hypothetical protein
MRAAAGPPPPPSSTDWTRLVPPPVLTGHERQQAAAIQAVEEKREARAAAAERAAAGRVEEMERAVAQRESRASEGHQRSYLLEARAPLARAERRGAQRAALGAALLRGAPVQRAAERCAVAACGREEGGHGREMCCCCVRRCAALRGALARLTARRGPSWSSLARARS